MRPRAPRLRIAAIVLLASACSTTAPATSSPLATAARPTPAPTTLHTTTPTAQPTSTTSVSPTFPASSVFASWTMYPMPIALPGVYGGNLPADIARYGRGFVAVGGVNGGCCDGAFSELTRALVWRSGEGANWRLVANQKAFKYGRMRAVAVHGARIVAVGDRNLDGIQPLGAVWTSDDGSDWSLVRDVPVFDDVAATAAGFVAIANADDGPSLWSSADGRDWQRMAEDLGPGSVARLLQLGQGYLAVGSESVREPDGGFSQRGLIWRSEGGATWQPVPAQGSLDHTSIQDAALIAGAYVAIGSTDSDDTDLMLRSSDGTTWNRASSPLLDAGVHFIRMIATKDTLIVIGSVSVDGDSRIAAWTSSDGLNWAEVRAQPGTDGPSGGIQGWIEAAGGIVGVGETSRGDELRAPAAWIIR